MQLPRGMAKSFTNLNLSSFLGENLPESTATGVCDVAQRSSERLHCMKLHPDSLSDGAPHLQDITMASKCSSAVCGQAEALRRRKVGTPCQNDLQSAEGLC